MAAQSHLAPDCSCLRSGRLGQGLTKHLAQVFGRGLKRKVVDLEADETSHVGRAVLHRHSPRCPSGPSSSSRRLASAHARHRCHEKFCFCKDFVLATHDSQLTTGANVADERGQHAIISNERAADFDPAGEAHPASAG
eukprot:scaffold8737_cov124-Isochrysis_galbana.AAC.7